MKNPNMHFGPVALKTRVRTLFALCLADGGSGRRRVREILLALMFSLCAPCLTWAVCSGAGATWSCAAGSTASQINSAISAASNQATITLANGSYSFTGVSLNGKNGLSIVCATERQCTLTGSGLIFDLSTSSATPITNLIRISGFVFGATSGGSPTIWIEGDVQVDNLRIDHCTFNQTNGVGIMTGHTQSKRKVNGVIDNNIFRGSTHNYPLEIFGAGNNDWTSSHQGTGDNLFIEDNIFDYASENLSASGIDCWNGGRLVVRHNTITNARVAVHGVCHDGPANLEVYDNTIANTSNDGGYRIIHHQGSGEFMVFNNIISPTSATMALLYYRSSTSNPEGCGTCDGSQSVDGNRSPTSTYHGYPCYRQPGRDGNGILRPVYLWNNKFSSTGKKINISIEDAATPSYLSYHLKSNRDYYEAVSNGAQTSPTSPFNGTTGMGFGTLANRPTTCTTGSEAADAGHGGVGYFATDTNILYRCSATNTWIAHYRPYAYPHPLRSALPAPGGVRIVQ